eukprot:6202082-Pleurochrysis_carterae.AAC.1
MNGHGALGRGTPVLLRHQPIQPRLVPSPSERALSCAASLHHARSAVPGSKSQAPAGRSVSRCPLRVQHREHTPGMHCTTRDEGAAE